MNVLITGCMGFVGYHLTKKVLENKKIAVYGIDNLDPFYEPKIKKKRISELEKNDNFDFFNIDLNDNDKMNLIFTNFKFDKIIHLGARAGVRTSIKIPLSYIHNNVLATNRLLKFAVESNVKDFIFGSSSSVYGNQEGPFHEDMTPKPISPYAASKRSCEIYGSTYSRLYDLNFIVLRLFTVYGPGQRPDMAIARFTKRIDNGNDVYLFGDGTFKRDFTYVDDIVQGIINSMSKQYKNDIFNLGCGNPITMLELIEIIEKEVGKKAKVKYLKKSEGDMKLTFADNSKAKKMLDYQPKISIKDGIKRYVEWYRDNEK